MPICIAIFTVIALPRNFSNLTIALPPQEQVYNQTLFVKQGYEFDSSIPISK